MVDSRVGVSGEYFAGGAIERRFLDSRASVTVVVSDDAPKRIVGYAAVFYDPDIPESEYRIGPSIVERIRRGAFDRLLASSPDVVALYNHDLNYVIGRTTSGTLRLSADDVGLRYEVDVPDNEMGRTIYDAVSRGDVSGASFSYRPTDSRLTFEVESGPAGERTVIWLDDLSVVDVGPTALPAYPGTTAEARGDGQSAIPMAVDAWRSATLEAVRARLRYIDISLSQD